MNFSELVQARYSVLEYDRRPVERDLIEKILAAGLAAPTACNFQPQRVLVIQDDAGRGKLNRVIPSKYYVPAAFLLCYDTRECWVRPMDGKSSGEIDTSIAATHMMLQATDLGLGSIWVMCWDPARMKQEFALPEHIEPVVLLIVGHKAQDAHPRKGHLISKSMEEILLE